MRNKALFLFGGLVISVIYEASTPNGIATLSSEARQDFTVLWRRSSLAHAERMVCLTLKGDTITSGSDYPWQVVDSVEVVQFGLPCKEGTAHTHIFGGRNFSRVDSLSLHKGLHCVLYSSKEALCSRDGKEKRVRF